VHCPNEFSNIFAFLGILAVSKILELLIRVKYLTTFNV
jgi:hypothetical protein